MFPKSGAPVETGSHSIALFNICFGVGVCNLLRIVFCDLYSIVFYLVHLLVDVLSVET
jgi:hypothetical protein